MGWPGGGTRRPASRTAGTWHAADVGTVKDVHVVDLVPNRKRPVTQRRCPAGKARFQGGRIRLICTPRARIVRLVRAVH
jgi:hypothetical protein